MGSYALSVVDSYEDMSMLAADAVQATLDVDPGAAITVPTGQTPLGMYEELVRRSKRGDLDLGKTQIFCLDDYLGKSRHDEASLTRWLFDVFLSPAGIPDEHIHLIPTMADDPNAAAIRFEAEIVEQGGLSLAVVGLGPNGHIAFNEPGSSPDSRTRVVDLTEKSRAQSAEYWEGSAEIPDRAITMGLGTILSAQKIVLIVSGEAKAEIVKRSLEEEPTLEVPGSWLQRAGGQLHVILDREAASDLTNR